jgi:hypothetical protein
MAATMTRPTLRETVLDALSDGYWTRRANIEECPVCTRHPAGVCAEHMEDSALAQAYEEARKRLENAPGDAEVVALLGAEEEAA